MVMAADPGASCSSASRSSPRTSTSSRSRSPSRRSSPRSRATSTATRVGFYLFQAFTALLLFLAANTSFNAFPRLRRRPRRGRLHPAPVRVPRRPPRVLARGSSCWASIAGAVVILGGGSTHALIPLYAVGVFIDFTIAQSGMVRHWLRTQDTGLAATAVDQRRRRGADRRDRDRRDLGEVPRRGVVRAGAHPAPRRDDAVHPAPVRRPGARARGPRRPRVRAAPPRAAGDHPGQRHQPRGRPGGDVRQVPGDRRVDAPGRVRDRRTSRRPSACARAGSASCRACRWSSSSRRTGRSSARSSPTSTSSTTPGRRARRRRPRSSCCPSTSPATGGTGCCTTRRPSGSRRRSSGASTR